MRVFFAVVPLVFSILFCSVPVAARESGDEHTVGVEGYCEALVNEFAKYEITAELIDTSNATAPSAEDYEAIPDLVKEFYESIGISVIPSRSSAFSPIEISPMVVEAPFSYGCDWIVYSDIGYATFQTIIQGDLDLQGANIMRITYTDTIFRSGMNYSEHDIIVEEIEDMSMGIIDWTVGVRVKFEYTAPHTGVTMTLNVDGLQSDSFDAHDYIVR